MVRGLGLEPGRGRGCEGLSAGLRGCRGEAALLFERRLELGELRIELAISRGVILPSDEVAEALGVAARPIYLEGAPHERLA